MAYIKEETITDSIEREKVDSVLRKMNSQNKRKLWIFKRIFDCTVSICALTVLAIPMAVIALIIFLSDGHSPLYKQERVTRFGNTF